MLVIPIELVVPFKNYRDAVYYPTDRRWFLRSNLGDPLSFREIPLQFEQMPDTFRTIRNLRTFIRKQDSFDKPKKLRLGEVAYKYMVLHRDGRTDRRNRYIRSDESLNILQEPSLKMVKETPLLSDDDYREITGIRVHVEGWTVWPESQLIDRTGRTWYPRLWDKWKPMPKNAWLDSGYVDFTYGSQNCVYDCWTRFWRDSTDAHFNMVHHRRTVWLENSPHVTYHTSTSLRHGHFIEPYKTGRYEETVDKLNQIIDVALREG